MQQLKKLDDGLARGEAAIAAVVLLLMIVLAALQAVLYNLATNAELAWASNILGEVAWIDDFLQKGTLWLAFLGASLATHADKHIAIDALSRVMPGRLRLFVKGLVSLAAGITSYFLARVFYTAAFLAQERPLEYEVLADGESMHICNAPAEAIAEARLSRPDLFCMVRDAFDALGVVAPGHDGVVQQVETPVAALQLIVPAMFLWIGVRLVARGVGCFAATFRGDGDGQMPESVARRKRKES